jgi:hypothetical protein
MKTIHWSALLLRNLLSYVMLRAAEAHLRRTHVQVSPFASKSGCFGGPQHDTIKFPHLPIPPRGMRGLSMTGKITFEKPS